MTDKTELKLGQYQNIVREVDFDNLSEDWIKLFNLLTGENFKVENIEVEIKILNAMSPFLEGISFDKFSPDVIKIMGKEVKLSKQVGNVKIGQAIALLQTTRKLKYVDEGLSKAIAIYLQPLIDNDKFSLTRALEIEKELLEMPAFMFHSWGNFIYGQLQKGGTLSLNLRKLIQNSQSKVQKTLRHTWQIVVALPAMGIFRLLFVMLRSFHLTLITFMKIVLSLRFVTFSVMKKTWVNLKKGTPNITTS